MGKATIRRALGMYPACPRHVYAEGLSKGCGSNSEGFPKHPEAMRKSQTSPDRTLKGSRRLADDAKGLRTGCRRVPEGLRSTPKPSRSNLRVQILKLLKVRCRRNFDPESVPKASRRNAEGFPIIPKECRRYAEGGEFVICAFVNASEPFGVLVETGLYCVTVYNCLQLHITRTALF